MQCIHVLFILLSIGLAIFTCIIQFVAPAQSRIATCCSQRERKRRQLDIWLLRTQPSTAIPGNEGGSRPIKPRRQRG